MKNNLNLLDRWQAADFLHHQLPHRRTARQWYGYLCRNRTDPQYGYRITLHLKNGNAHYTEQALLEFVRVMTTRSTTKAA
ncbi:hypothetical protein [Acinetobacter puyangensis]|uniref:hypothetical protein n=1 Tax=Acinetobacter puyangensis TaxID=1096779 RepID=UPI003A4E4F7F